MDTNMCPRPSQPLNPPLLFPPGPPPSLNLLVMMQLTESGESRGGNGIGGGGGGILLPGPLGVSQSVENVHSLSLHPPPETQISRKRWG